MEVAMALGRRRREEQGAWVATTDLPKSPGHVFYRKLNQLLAEADFDTFVEALCREHYADEVGRPGIPPGVYFRMLLVGYFEGIGSQRGIAWRCSDSLSLREFLGLGATESSPDHSSLTRVRERLPLEVHEAMFRFVLQIAAAKKLLSGKTVAVDSTTLEANAAMKTIVRHDTGEDWKAYLRRLMQEQGLIEKDHEPTDEELRRFDKQRKDKKVSNDQWGSKTDPDSRIAKMKDGRTHLAYKAENVVDLKTDLVLAAEIYPADHGDTQTLVDSVLTAQLHLAEAGLTNSIDEVAADKGYHAAPTLELADSLNLRTYIPQPQRKRDRVWTDKPQEYQRAVTNNRRRTQRAKGRRLQRKRSELVERTFAHMCETGGARRSWLCGIEKLRKRWLVQGAARNLGLMLRKLFGIGTARTLQDAGRLALRVHVAWLIVLRHLRRNASHSTLISVIQIPGPNFPLPCSAANRSHFSTGC
jgi:transposase